MLPDLPDRAFRNLDPAIRVLAARQRHLRMSQRALAQRVGTSQSATSDMLHGTDVRLSTLRRLCNALGCELMVVSRQREVSTDA